MSRGLRVEHIRVGQFLTRTIDERIRQVKIESDWELDSWALFSDSRDRTSRSTHWYGGFTYRGDWY